MNREQIGKYIVMVPQTVNLFNDTIRNNLLLKSFLSSDEQLGKCCTKLAWISIQRMPNGLDTMVSEFGSNLSGGQKQMMVLSRALLTDAEYIIF